MGCDPERVTGYVDGELSEAAARETRRHLSICRVCTAQAKFELGLGRSGFGTTCIQCGKSLIAPEWSEYVSERQVLNLWSCTKCGLQFESSADLPAAAKLEIDREVLEEFFPSLLVA